MDVSQSHHNLKLLFFITQSCVFLPLLNGGLTVT